MNNYYQQSFQPYYQQQQATQQQTIQTGTLLNVRNENEARMYPVGPGYSVIFKDENKPYIYTKTMGFNQFDTPVFERYKLIKEETDEPTLPAMEVNKYALKNDLADLVNKVMDLQEEIFALKGDNRKRTEGDGRIGEC